MMLSDLKEQTQLCTFMSRSMTTCRVRDYADTINGVAGNDFARRRLCGCFLYGGGSVEAYPGA